MQGYYGRDHRFFTEYHEQSRTLEGYEHWLRRWVYEVHDRREYLERLGAQRLAPLAVRQPAFSVPANFGY